MSKSIYYKITGKIIDAKKLDIENFEYNILNYNYDLQIFPTYWKGLEDIRFIDNNNMTNENNSMSSNNIFTISL